MVKKIIRSYYKFFDEKIENGIIVIFIIIILIVLASLFVNNGNINSYTKNNILETNNNIVKIDGIEYKRLK